MKNDQEEEEILYKKTSLLCSEWCEKIQGPNQTIYSIYYIVEEVHKRKAGCRVDSGSNKNFWELVCLFAVRSVDSIDEKVAFRF